MGRERTWTQPDARGGHHPARSGHAMAYDPARGRVVLFGGSGTGRGHGFEDTWEWDGASGSGPTGRRRGKPARGQSRDGLRRRAREAGRLRGTGAVGRGRRHLGVGGRADRPPGLPVRCEWPASRSRRERPARAPHCAGLLPPSARAAWADPSGWADGADSGAARGQLAGARGRTPALAGCAQPGSRGAPTGPRPPSRLLLRPTLDLAVSSMPPSAARDRRGGGGLRSRSGCATGRRRRADAGGRERRAGARARVFERRTAQFRVGSPGCARRETAAAGSYASRRVGASGCAGPLVFRLGHRSNAQHVHFRSEEAP